MHDKERTEIMVAADLPRVEFGWWLDFTVRSALQVGNVLSNSASFTFCAFLHRSQALRLALPGLTVHTRWMCTKARVSGCSKQCVELVSQDTVI